VNKSRLGRRTIQPAKTNLKFNIESEVELVEVRKPVATFREIFSTNPIDGKGMW
jgi:hypothetical protein